MPSARPGRDAVQRGSSGWGEAALIHEIGGEKREKQRQPSGLLAVCLWTLSQLTSAKKGIRVDFEHAHPFPLSHLLGRKRGIFVLVANEIAEEDWRQ